MSWAWHGSIASELGVALQCACVSLPADCDGQADGPWASAGAQLSSSAADPEEERGPSGAGEKGHPSPDPPPHHILHPPQELLENVYYVWALCRDQSQYDPITAWKVLEFGIAAAGKMLV